MTLCEKCRKPMIIESAMVDFGEGEEEVEFEACPRCRVLYVSAADWTVESEAEA